MLIGELAMVASESWGWQIAGRLVAGAGGVLLNVQMTKMVTDWFAGREIATAMAIFVNSWPAGIAISLLIAAGDRHQRMASRAVYLSVAALIAVGILLAACRLSGSARRCSDSRSPQRRPDRRALLAVIVAGLIWGLFNIGFAMIFSFGPTLLAERGWSITAAGSAISIVLWLSVVQRARRRLPGRSLQAAAYDHDRRLPRVRGADAGAAAQRDAVIAVVVALGLVGGLPAGPIMSLPARVLRRRRARSAWAFSTPSTMPP